MFLSFLFSCVLMKLKPVYAKNLSYDIDSGHLELDLQQITFDSCP